MIREHRIEAGLTQRELAGAAGLSVGALRDLEQGRTNCPRWQAMEELSAALGLDPGQRAGLRGALVPESRISRVETTGQMVQAGSATSTPSIRVSVLGPLAALRAETQLALGGIRQRAVLGLLAIQWGTVVQRDALVDFLWAEKPPESAVVGIQGYISKLRNLLEPGRPRGSRAGLISSIGVGYQLCAAVQLDVAEFHELIGQAHRAAAGGRVHLACDLYEQALGLWRGDVLADLGSLGRQHPVVIELAAERAEAVACYAGTAALAAMHDRALTHLRALCSREPYNEKAHAQLMVSLAAAGQQATALRVFGQLTERLAGELGISPGQEARQARSRILLQRTPQRVAAPACPHVPLTEAAVLQRSS